MLLCGSGLLSAADLFDRAPRAVTAMGELSLFFSCRFSGAGAFLLVREGTQVHRKNKKGEKGNLNVVRYFKARLCSMWF